MEQFDIIGSLESYAISKGWRFLYGFDKFYNNIGVQEEYANGDTILTADFRATPTVKNGRVTEIRYSCLLMLGRKIDADGVRSSLDETSMQKYDRRLKDLIQMLAYGMADFACINELDLVSLPIEVDINVYDENLDFAISNNAIFVQ